MDILFWLVMAAVVLPILGWVFWVVIFVWIARAFMNSAERDLNRMFADVERTLAQAQGGGAAQMSPQQQAQIAQMLMNAQLQMGRLDDLQRQRYDVRMGELSSMAANAGLDWSPSSY